MIKVYGSELCPDCLILKANLDRNKIEYEYVDINASLKNLKEFLRIRDNNELFKDAKEKGYIGIPLILDDNLYSLNYEQYLEDRGYEVISDPSLLFSSCSKDGHC